MKTPEGAVLAACEQLLRARGIPYRRNNVGTVQVRRGKWYRFGLGKGSADIVGIIPAGPYRGHALTVEVKRESGGVISQDQQDFAAEVIDAGGIALVTTSAAQLDEGLRKLGAYD